MLEKSRRRGGFQGEVVIAVKYSWRVANYENRQREGRWPLTVKISEMERGKDDVITK